jgi:hypothetical protein
MLDSHEQQPWQVEQQEADRRWHEQQAREARRWLLSVALISAGIGLAGGILIKAFL